MTFGTSIVGLATLFLFACGGDILETQGDAGSSGDAGSPAQSTCVVTHCNELVGHPIPRVFGFDASAGYCGQIPTGDTSKAKIVFFEPDGACECNVDDAGIVNACTVITPQDCQAKSACGACNAGLACEWCLGSDDDRSPHCDQNGFECMQDADINLAHPDCTP